MDVFCGTNKDTRMAIRFIMEVAWQGVVDNFLDAADAELFQTISFHDLRSSLIKNGENGHPFRSGIYTGRSPKDKFIVMDENSKDTVWWTSDEFKNDNKPVNKEW